MQPNTNLDLWMCWQSGPSISTCANESLPSWAATPCLHRHSPQRGDKEDLQTLTIFQTGDLLLKIRAVDCSQILLPSHPRNQLLSLGA